MTEPMSSAAALAAREWLTDAFTNHLPEIQDLARFYHPGSGDLRPPLKMVAPLAIAAQTLVWHQPMYAAATTGAAEVFGALAVKQEQVLRCQPQFWIYHSGRNLNPGDDRLDIPCYLLGSLLLPLVYAHPDTNAPTLGITACGVHISQRHGTGDLPRLRFADTLYVGESPCGLAADTIAALEFLQQEVVVTESLVLPRHVRRRYEREKRTPADIRTVALRRAKRPEKEPVATDQTSSGREWSCQWLVGAHWRLQPYPSLGIRKPTFIAPHVKGPADKPLRTPARSVFQVMR